MKFEAQQRIVTKKEWIVTILGLAILFGFIVRVLPAFFSDFPINDGGMFAVMMRDLLANKFALPVVTTYNQFDIPFAYPPLGFYIGASQQILGFTEMQVLIWLPTLFTLLTIPCFYLLASELTENRLVASLASVFFALAPGSYAWLLMGGGLTRSLGVCLSLLALYFVHSAYRELNFKKTFWATLFCALTVLSHPQAALLVALGSLIFFLFAKPSGKVCIHAFVIALGTVVFTAPWWLFIVVHHGLGVFVSVAQSGELSASVLGLLKNLFSIQTTLPLATIFRILGLGWVFYTRRFDLLTWGFLLFFIDQRSAPIVTSFFYPILSTFGVFYVLPIVIQRMQKQKWEVPTEDVLMNWRPLSLGLLGIIFYLFIECSFHAFVILQLRLPNEAYQMMTWVKENTPDDSRFLIVTGHGDVMTDAVQEWFPALTERHSETTLQGLEWMLQDGFQKQWDQLSLLQGCRDLRCIKMQAQSMNLEFTYFILDKNALIEKEFLADALILFENNRYIIILE